MRDFNILRAVFWLLATVVIITMLLVATGIMTCTFLVFIGQHKPGTCIEAGIAEELHNVWTEMLTAILALLAAGRGGSPPSNGDRHDRL